MNYSKLLIALSLLSLTFVNEANANTRRVINYHIEPLMNGNDLTSIEIVISFEANNNGKTILTLPSEWGGGVRLYENIKNIRVIGANSIAEIKPETRIIYSRAKAHIVVRYRIDVNRARGEEIPIESTFSNPVLAPDWFFIAGPTFIATLEGRNSDKISFSWNLPHLWNGATNLESTNLVGADFDATQSIFIAGRDVQIAKMKVPYGDLRIAWRGKFGFTSQEFNRAAHDIIASEQMFWAEGQRHFLVALAPLEARDDWSSIRGSGLGNSFPIVTTPNNSVKQLKVILAHEYFHSWNPMLLGGFDESSAETSQYWFSEGFTDFYGRKMAYESGTIDAAEFVSQWNTALAEYAASPYRSAPNSVVVNEQFWNDRDVRKLPYQRGAMFAALLNAKWRSERKSLDGLMRILRSQTKLDKKLHLKSPPLEQRLSRAAKSYGVDFGELIKQYMINGKYIILPDDTFALEFKIVTENVSTIDYGYDVAKSRAAGYFVGVKPNGNAFAAGLRDGMKRVSSSGGTDSKLPITWRVIDGEGKEREIVYLPSNVVSIRQRLVFK